MIYSYSRIKNIKKKELEVYVHNAAKYKNLLVT